jgi:hypothetical protein
MKRVKLFSISLALAGCFHRSPDLAVLAPFGEGNPPFSDDSGHAVYVRFRDSLTAKVFKRYVQTGVAKLAPAGSTLYCSEVQGDVTHGYVIGVRADSVWGDSAFASLGRSCRRMPPTPPGEMIIGAYCDEQTLYLMVRENGKWLLRKALGGSIGIPM